jgi:hypothetical protein
MIRFLDYRFPIRGPDQHERERGLITRAYDIVDDSVFQKRDLTVFSHATRNDEPESTMFLQPAVETEPAPDPILCGVPDRACVQDNDICFTRVRGGCETGGSKDGFDGGRFRLVHLASVGFDPVFPRHGCRRILWI